MSEYKSPQARLRRARSSIEAEDALLGPGVHIVSPNGTDRCGLVAHRGVLHHWEWYDRKAVLRTVEQELGFTSAEMHSVYRQGRLSGDQRLLRAKIDARLVALAQAGGNMSLLGSLLGFGPTGNNKAFKNALRRGRQLKEAA